MSEENNTPNEDQSPDIPEGLGSSGETIVESGIVEKMRTSYISAKVV